MTWNPKTSWNVCKTRACRGPVEGPGGSVEFFDGGEAYCIECGREYVVHCEGGDCVRLEPIAPRKRRKGVRR